MAAVVRQKPRDSGMARVGYANAATGVFDTYQQINNIREDQNGYHNYEGYIQDTWRLGRLTLDYGLRLIDQVPQHDRTPARATSNVPAPVTARAGCGGATSSALASKLSCTVSTGGRPKSIANADSGTGRGSGPQYAIDDPGAGPGPG